MRVLVFPGGTEIGLEIWSALRNCKDVELAAAGMEVASHAPFVFSEFHSLPGVFEAGWLEELNGLIGKLRIDYVFPAHDEVILALAEHASQVSAPVVMSPPETCRIARFKSKTYDALRGALPVPRVFSNPEEIGAFPVFCKPDRGQGSYRARRVDSREELAADFGPGDLLLEYLPGVEYTVDCFSDRERGLLFVGGRERTRVRNGIAVATSPVEDPLFETYARAISERLALHGAWFFQLKRDREGRMKLLEVGPRIAGSMALYRVSGVNFPLLSLYEQRRLPLRILRNHVRVSLNRALVNRYEHDLVYRTVYVDLDDTLILRGQVNARLVALLYQCVARGVRLTLLTRHAQDVDQTLERYRLSQLFDEVIHLTAGESKAEAIRERSAIFIDDSFAERRGVQEATGIPTFDCSMIEMLFDDRDAAGGAHAPEIAAAADSPPEVSEAAYPPPGFPRRVAAPSNVESLLRKVPVPVLGVTGDLQITITSVATPQDALPGSLCFCQDPEVTQAHPAFLTRASVLVVACEVPPVPGRCTIRTEDPRRWVASAMRWLFPRSSHVDATARLGERVRLGQRVSIGAYAVIGNGVSIGDDTAIGSHVVVLEDTEIGSRCDVQPGTVIGSDGFAHYRNLDGGMYTLPHLGCVRIGNDVEIGGNCVIVRGMLNDTIIEDGVKIGNLCNVGHNCVLGRNAGVTSHVVLAGSVTLGEGCDIGTGAAIKQHITIGAGARVGMGSVVTKNVDPGQGVFGDPAQPLRTMRSLRWPGR